MVVFDGHINKINPKHNGMEGIKYLSFVRNKRISSKHSINPLKTELRLRQVTLFHLSSPLHMEFPSLRKF